MSNSPRAKARRTKRSHMSKHQRGIMSSQHYNNRCAQHNAEIRGTGEDRIKKLMEVTNGS